MNEAYNLVPWLHRGHRIGLDEDKELLHYTLLESRHLIEYGLLERPNLKAMDEVIIRGHQCGICIIQYDTKVSII